jgi:hypothetical protein
MDMFGSARAIPISRLFLVLASCLMVTNVRAEGPAVLGDLDPLSPEKLSKEQLDQLIPGAKMKRITAGGSTHLWTNEADGTFTVSTDNRGTGGGTAIMAGNTSAPGKWHVAPDGRYCVTIEWRKYPTEDWCRYVFKTTDGYYGTKSDHDRSAKVYRITINGS